MKNFGESLRKRAYYFVIKMINCLPIKKNKIFIYSYYGGQYGDNPKYISEYLINNYSKDTFDVVWAFNEPEKKDISCVRKVKTMSLKYFYELCTSKVIITNFRTTEYFKKRNNQYYIQTWHSSLRLKKIEGDVGNRLKGDYIAMAKKDSERMDLLLSGCKYSTSIFKRAFWYKGEILQGGTPRNDIFFGNNDKLKVEIKNKLGIEDEIKILLYAPTFRNLEGVEVYDVDFAKTLKALKERFNGTWIALAKLHPHMINQSKEIIKGDGVMDVTSYDDIQELLLIADVLISDYSSLIFDFGIGKKPCFLYVPDLSEYISKERELYFNIEELPFVITKNNKELKEKILRFDESKYEKDILVFDKKVGTFEDGKCAERVGKKIYEVCYGKEN